MAGFTKEGLKKDFSKDWKDKYETGVFRREGFVRKTCKCGNTFWTLDPDRETCGSPPCDNYGFIGSPITGEKLDYVETWKKFEKFFVRNGHTSVPRYPVVDRWRPDLYFTIASIQDFQRIDSGNTVMEYPSDPLIVPQVCLRFPDIPNVGITGRHHTSFVMSGQHSFGRYWKDRTIELNFDFLTKIMGIPKEELTYVEDVWAMPDFSQFGPSLETFSRGLELVNSVFSAYTASGTSYKELPKKVIDVGWGHERLVWFSNGTPSGYDSVFGPVINWMKKYTGLHENELLRRYAVFAGGLTYDEVENISKVKQELAEKLGVTQDELHKTVEPMQALYAIADHMKTLLFAVSDGGIPSNVGGGYNLRVILRRCLAFMQEFGFDFELMDIAKRHARFLKPMFPELKDGLESLGNVLETEEARYIKSMEKAKGLVVKQLERGIKTDDLILMYTSNGISPELVERIARQENRPFTVPEDFYSRLTESHLSGRKETERKENRIDVSDLPDTNLVFYRDPYATKFRARVLDVRDGWAVFDSTLFYPEGGGQPSDQGIIRSGGKEIPVKDVRKIGGVVIHRAPGIKKGDIIEGEIDWNRRFRLMQMHTSTHIIAGTARKIIGKHIWQAGAAKDMESSRIDLTHYKPFTEEELDTIEREANRIVKKAIPVNAVVMKRQDAEKKYGFVLYQGGASPGKKIRVIAIKGVDAEACAGTHLTNTGDAETIKIIRSERIQDGVNRIEFTVSDAAKKFVADLEETYEKAREILSGLPFSGKSLKHIKNDRYTEKKLHAASLVFSVEPAGLVQALEKFSGEIRENLDFLNKSREKSGDSPLSLEDAMSGLSPKTVPEACRDVFSFWKLQKKEIEKAVSRSADSMLESLMKKAKDMKVFEVLHGTRKELIETAGKLLKKEPGLTVILANEAGDIIGMSNTDDMSEKIRTICEQAGGKGGGRPKLAQGRVELSKLLKIMGQ